MTDVRQRRIRAMQQHQTPSRLRKWAIIAALFGLAVIAASVGWAALSVAFALATEGPRTAAWGVVIGFLTGAYTVLWTGTFIRLTWG